MPGAIPTCRPTWRAMRARRRRARCTTRCHGADIFLGLSAPNVLKPEWLGLLADKPLILALANPDPEITPEAAHAARADAIVATGRTDYPNQVNNVLCFPFIFRGALDVGATTINEAMKLAAMEAIAELARDRGRRRGGRGLWRHRAGIRPRLHHPQAIRPAADPEHRRRRSRRRRWRAASPRRPITDFDAYRLELERFAYRSGQVMRPVFEAARKAQMRIAYAEGEDERVLRAVQTVLDERIGQPVLVGRRSVIEARVHELGLRLDLGGAVRVLDPGQDSAVFEPLVRALSASGGTPRHPARGGGTAARDRARGRGGDAARRGRGGCGDLRRHRRLVAADAPRAADHPALPAGDAHLRPLLPDPASGRAVLVRYLHERRSDGGAGGGDDAAGGRGGARVSGMAPKVALVSHSSFGASNAPRARKMRAALALVRAQAPDLEVDGEMHADAALNEVIRGRAVPDSRLSGSANLLVMPTLDAANISFNLLKAAADGLPVGPLLLGMSKPIHVAMQSVTARGLVNISAIAALQAAAGG